MYRHIGIHGLESPNTFVLCLLNVLHDFEGAPGVPVYQSDPNESI